MLFVTSIEYDFPSSKKIMKNDGTFESLFIMIVLLCSYINRAY